MGSPGSLIPAKGVVNQTIFAMGGVFAAAKGGAMLSGLCGGRRFGRRGGRRSGLGGLSAPLFSYAATVLGTFVLDKANISRPNVDAFQVGGLAYVGLSILKSFFGKTFAVKGLSGYEELGEGDFDEEEGLFGDVGDEEGSPTNYELDMTSGIGQNEGEGEEESVLGEYEVLPR